ncbi:helix-turn-helix domain-containing protein [Candidatus Woesearchaeota archaeon]|nr:helix-turn-helix domain-containing protein [Candidatus Woesearchaeota archaeon]
MKKSLTDEIGILLLRKGFTVKSLLRGSFDLAARKGATILLIKVLEDANSITQETAEAMRKVSSYIDAAPITISKKAGGYLEDGVVYSRFGVYTLNYATFMNALENRFPFIMSSKAGLTASVIGEKLRQMREESGYSLGQLSRKVGVSKRMIAKYETGQADVSVNKAFTLHKIFGPAIFRQIAVFNSWKNFPGAKKSLVAEKYTHLGFEADDTKKVPFDVIARKDSEIILTEIGDKQNPQLQPLQKLLEADTLVIFKDKKPKKIAAMTKKEFMSYDSALELIKFVKEFEQSL